MTEPIQTPDPTQTDPNELQILREHNKKLLAELKTARSDAKTAAAAAQTAQARLLRWAVEQPLQALAKRLSPHPETFARLLKDHIDVTLDDAGEPRVTNKIGEPLTIAKGRDIVPVAFTFDGLSAWLNGPDSPLELAGLRTKAQGSGAPGSGGYVAPSPASAKPVASAPPERPAYGLR